jgi:hypothetical protein
VRKCQVRSREETGVGKGLENESYAADRYEIWSSGVPHRLNENKACLSL